MTHHALAFGLVVVAITYVQTSFLPDVPCPLQFKVPDHTGIAFPTCSSCEDCPDPEALLKPIPEVGSGSGWPREWFWGVSPMLWPGLIWLGINLVCSSFVFCSCVVIVFGGLSSAKGCWNVGLLKDRACCICNWLAGIPPVDIFLLETLRPNGRAGGPL